MYIGDDVSVDAGLEQLQIWRQNTPVTIAVRWP